MQTKTKHFLNAFLVAIFTTFVCCAVFLFGGLVKPEGLASSEQPKVQNTLTLESDFSNNKYVIVGGKVYLYNSAETQTTGLTSSDVGISFDANNKLELIFIEDSVSTLSSFAVSEENIASILTAQKTEDQVEITITDKYDEVSITTSHDAEYVLGELAFCSSNKLKFTNGEFSLDFKPTTSFTEATSNEDAQILYLTGGEFSLDGGSSGKTYTGKSNVVGPAILSSGEVSLTNITLNAFADGAYAGSGTSVLNCSSCTFSENTNNIGGAIYASGIVNLTDCIFTQNSSTSYGGAIYMYQNSAMKPSLSIVGGELSNNTATLNGGAIHGASASVTITLNGVNASGNSAKFGGAIYNHSGTVNLISGTLSENIASSNGGAIYNNAGTVELSGATISGNTAVQSGGGVYNNGIFTMTGGAITGNMQTQENTSNVKGGGGIYNYSDSAICTLSGGSITNNTAYACGGAIYNYSGTVELSGATISENSITLTTGDARGGGIYNYGYADDQAIITINSGTISGNTSYYGSVIYNDNGNSITNIKGGTLSGSASQYGEAIYLNSAAYLNIGTSLSSNIKIYKQGLKSIDDGDVASSYIAYSTNSTHLSTAKTYLSIVNYAGYHQHSTAMKTNYLVCEYKSYTASFNGNGGSNGTSITKKYKAALGTLPSSTRTGYTFGGWFTATSGGTKISTTTTMPSSNTTYYAQWTINSYTLHIFKGQENLLSAAEMAKAGTGSSNNNCTTTYSPANGGTWTSTPTSTSDPFSTIPQTVSLTANTKYYIHMTIRNADGSIPSGSIQLFLAISKGYNETNSVRFHNGGGYAEYTPTTTGVYNMRMDNDYSGKSVVVTNFWVSSAAATNYTTATVNYASTYDLGTPSRTGHTFDGWTVATGTYTMNNKNSATTISGSASVSGNTVTMGAGAAYVFANYDRNTYTVTISRNNTSYGTVSASSVTAYYGAAVSTSGATLTVGGSSVTATATAATAQYTYALSSWTNATGSITAARTITANFTRTANTYTVTFAPNGGSVSQTSKSVTYDSTYGTLPTPTRTGYTFLGWNGKNLLNVANSLVTPEYTTFVSDGKLSFNVKVGTNTINAFKIQRYLNGTYVNQMHSSSSLGFNSYTFTKDSTFNRLRLAVNGSTKDSNYIVDISHLTNGTSYTISYKLDSLNSSACTAVVSEIMIEEGSSFTGYQPYYVLSTSTVNIAKNHTLTAIWNPNIYKVTLDNQSATTAGTTTYYYQFNTTKTINGVLCYYYTDSACTTGLTDGYYITIPTKTGYDFGGYYTGTGGSGTQYVNASGACVNNLYYNNASDITLYAKWTIKQYLITIGVTNSSYGSVSATSIYVNHGSTLSSTTGANLGGLLVDGSTVVTATANSDTAQYTYVVDSWTNATGTVTAAKTVTVTFSRTLNIYGTRFNPNGGTITLKTNSQAITNGTEIIVNASYGTNISSLFSNNASISRSGYTFKGWYTASSGGSVVSTVSGGATVYAQWNSNTTYKITIQSTNTTITFSDGQTASSATTITVASGTTASASLAYNRKSFGMTNAEGYTNYGTYSAWYVNGSWYKGSPPLTAGSGSLKVSRTISATETWKIITESILEKNSGGGIGGIMNIDDINGDKVAQTMWLDDKFRKLQEQSETEVDFDGVTLL